MVLGDLQAWTSQFTSVDERFLERIAVVWPACINILSSQAHEDTITINLVELLCKDPVVRRLCHWVEYQFEPTGTKKNGEKYSKGKIDIAILLDWNRERYIAYECKRLNVKYSDKRNSLATAYVADGMMRFIESQYAKKLPFGCMLGYVMDGDLQFAINQLNSAIAAHKPLDLVIGPTATAHIQKIARFRTIHNRPIDTRIELRHALLPFRSLLVEDVKDRE